MAESIEQINEYLDYLFAYGPFWVYSAIFVACLIENLFPPFPGDTFVVAGGGLVAAGRLDLWPTLALIIIGGLTSVMMLYSFGRKRGRNFFLRKNYKYFGAADIMKMEQSFAKRGAWILLFSRFVVGARAALAVVAGIGRYPAWRTLLFSGMSYLIFCGLLIYIGYALVENLDLLEDYIKTYNAVVWPAVIVLVLLWLGNKIVRARRGVQK